MQSLSEQAIAKARLMVAEKFQDPNSLEDLGVISFQLEKQLAAVEGQLNGAVQGKLDSLKRAVDLMDESVAKLSKLSSNIQKIDEKIALTNTSISNFENLKRAANARENLLKVLNQVDFFVSVPELVSELGQKLHHPSALRDVYLEAVKLESLRAALIKEMKVSRNRRMNVSDGSASVAGGDYSEETYQRVRMSVEKHLRIVPELMREVWTAVYGSIDRMFDLAPKAPEDLVAAFEVVEMQQEYNERRNKALDLLRRSNKNDKRGSFENSNVATERYEDISANIQHKVRKILDHQVEGEFEAITGYLQETKSFATAFIMAANQTLFKLKFFQQVVNPCLPPHYDGMFMFLEAFEMFFTPKLEEIVGQVGTLKVSEILDLITWIEYHKVSLDDIAFGSRESIEQYALLKEQLLGEYKVRIKDQVGQWFQNIQKQPLEITKATNNTLVSSKPEDMFNIIHAQLSVAHDKLPPEYVKEVGIACLQVLQESQRETYDTLLRGGQSQGAGQGEGLEVEVICALINDNERMQEKCDEFGKDLLKIVEGDERELLEAVLDEVSREYLNIAKKAVQTLSRSIIDVLDEPVFAKLFTLQWEKSEEQVVNTLVITLQDYFGDLELWLSSYHFSQLVKELLVNVIKNYLMQLRKRVSEAGEGGFTFVSELFAAQQMIAERVALQDFFETYVPMPGVKNKEGLMVELESMQYVVKIVTGRVFATLENDVKALCKRYGVDGLRLSQAAFLCNPSVPKAERQQNVEQAKRVFEQNALSQSYATLAMEEFIGYDNPLQYQKEKEGQKKQGGFWSRLRKN